MEVIVNRSEDGCNVSIEIPGFLVRVYECDTVRKALDFVRQIKTATVMYQEDDFKAEVYMGE